MNQPSDPIRHLREATAGLNEATVQLVDRIHELEEHQGQYQGLHDWITAVAHHALAADTVVRHLEPGTTEPRRSAPSGAVVAVCVDTTL